MSDTSKNYRVEYAVPVSKTEFVTKREYVRAASASSAAERVERAYYLGQVLKVEEADTAVSP